MNLFEIENSWIFLTILSIIALRYATAGMGGQLSNGVITNPQAFILVGIPIVKGFFRSKKLNNKALKYLLLVVLISACIKLFFTS